MTLVGEAQFPAIEGQRKIRYYGTDVTTGTMNR